jgi:hypothetical protein
MCITQADADFMLQVFAEAFEQISPKPISPAKPAMAVA